MPRYAAFLRAINVGGRVVKMDELRRVFATMGFSHVQTFIASGNVIFESSQRSIGRMEQAIENGLADALKYPVATFVRSVPELVALVAHPAFSAEALAEGASLFVVFTRDPPEREVTRKLTAFRSEVDEFQVHQSHVLWLRRGTFHDSRFAGAFLERTLGMPATVRNATTVRKLVQKFGGT